MNKSKKKNINLIAGLIIVLLNLFWVWRNLYLLYMYNYSGRLWMIMFPEWTLLLNSVLGLLGITIGLRLTLNKLTIKKGLISSIFLIIIGELIQLIVT